MADQILVLFFIVAVGLNLGLAAYGWRYRRIPGALAFSLAMLMFAALPLMQAININSSDMATKIIALKSRVEAAGIGVIAWLIMILQLTGPQRRLDWRWLLTLSVAPLIVFILNWLESPLFRSNYALSSSNVLHWRTGPLFWFAFLYLNMLLLASVYILWRSYRRTSPLSFKQTLALSLAGILPIVVNAIFQLEFVAIPAVNFPFAAGPLMGLIVAWTIFRYQLFDLVPVARGQLIESMSDGVLVLDAQGRIVDINPAMRKLMGFVRIGQSAESVLAAWPDLLERFHGVQPVQTEIFMDLDPPCYFDCRISPLFEQGDQLSGHLLVVRDITSRKQTEQQMQLQSAALNATANAIAITDRAGQIEWVNPAFSMLTGYQPEECIGRNMRILRSNRHTQSFYKNLWETVHAGLVWEDEITNLRKDGHAYVEQQTITPVKDEHGQITHFISVKQDITARRQMEVALRRAEIKYRSLVEQIPAAVYMDEPNEEAASLYDSPQVEAMFGYSLDEWSQDPFFWKKCIHPADLDLAMKVIHATLNQGESVQEYRMLHKNGSTVWVRDHARLIRDEEGKPRYVQGFLEDITDHRRDQDLLQRQNSYLETLHQITLDLLNQTALDELLQSIVDRAAQFLRVPYCEVMLLEGDELVVQAFTKNTPFLMGDRVKREQAYLSWQAFDSQLPAVVNDYPHWSLKRSTYEAVNLSAVVSVPIVVAGRSIGVIDLSTSTPDYVFDHSEIEAAGLFTQLAGLALTNTKLHAEAQHEITQRKRTEETLRTQNDYLSALHDVALGLINRLDPDSVLEAILIHVTNLMQTRHALVDIVDREENILVQKVGLGNYVPHIGFRTQPGQGLTGHVWETGEVLVIPDYSKWEGRLDEFRWLRSVAGLPLKVNDQVIGVIAVSFDQPDRAFRPAEIELLQRFADLAAVALDHAQLVTSAIRQSQELHLLHQVRTAITREWDIRQIARRTVEAITETFGYACVGLYLLEGDMLILQHQVGYETVIPKIAVTEGLSGRALRSGKAILLEDVRADPAFLGTVDGIMSEVAVPLTDDGKPVGILNIESRHGFKLTKADLNLMQALGDQVSIALSRARVYNDLERKNARLSMLHEIALDLLNQREPDQLPQTISDQVVRLLDGESGYIALRDGEDLVDRAVSPPTAGYLMTRTGPADVDTPLWQVFRSHQTFVTDDYSALPTIRREPAALGIRALLLTPILNGDACQGVIGTARYRPNDPFDEDDIRFANLFSNLAAVALENAQLNEALRQESIRDPLTGLFNRRFMEESLTQELHRAERNSRSLSVVMLDLDHFKHINDTYGHDFGDEILRKLGLLLRTYFRGSDIACRYGGEEFTLILPEATLKDATQRMEELRQDVKQLTIRHEGKTVRNFSGSFGIAVYPQHGTTGEQLLKLADEALYRAKQLGRDRVQTA